MKNSLIGIVAFFLAVIGSCKSHAPVAENKHPNVLFIMCDDLNDYQGSFGGHPNAKTPNIDKLAKSGTRFANAHTNVPLCSPSRNSLFTGIYPHTSKDFGWTPHFKNPILKDAKTFVELFRENGYVTMGSGKLLHIDVKKIWDEWGVERRINYSPYACNGHEWASEHPSVNQPFRGVNVVDGSFASLADVPKYPNVEPGDRPQGWTYGPRPFRYVSDDDRDPMPDEMHAEWAVKKIKELEQRNDSTPFFMGIGFVKPHTPLHAPQKYFDMFPLDEIVLPEIKDGDIDDSFYKSVYPDSEMGLLYYQKLKEAYPENNEGLKLFLQAYLACVAFVDDQIGVVMDALDNSKFADNTIVVFTSDHGWQMGEKDYLYKNSPWDESTKVPLIIRKPGESKKGTSVDQAVSLIDLYPTLVDMCNLKGSTQKSAKAPKTEGYSLRPFLQDPDYESWAGSEGALTLLGVGINKPIEGLAVGTNPKALWHVEVLKELPDEYILKQNYSYRTKHWRYIRYHNGKEELYDHRNDPNAWNNLADNPKFEEKKTELRKQVLEMVSPKQNR